VYLISTCNFKDNGYPIVTKKWLFCAYILNCTFILMFLAIFFNLVGSFLEIPDEEIESVRNLRIHYFGAFTVTGMLFTLKGKFINKNKNGI